MPTFIDPPKLEIVKNLKEMNKELFKKVLKLTAIRVPSSSCSQIMSGLRKLPKTMLDLPKTKSIIDDPNSLDKRFKLILMHPDVTNEESLPKDAQQVLKETVVEWTQFPLNLDYDFWTSEQILRAILPDDVEVPTSFEGVGHIGELIYSNRFC